MPPCFYWLDNGRRSHETPLRKNYGSVIALYKKSRESPAFLYFIRKTRLFALLSQIGRIAHHHILSTRIVTLLSTSTNTYTSFTSLTVP